MKRIDLTGQRFSRLKVIAFAGQAKNGNAMWRCICDCGNEVVVDSTRLRRGTTTSCGCYRKEKMRELIFKNPKTREQMGEAGPFIVDHTNIFALTHITKRNRSGVIGVSYDQCSGRWYARLFLRGKLVFNQSFAERADAIKARHQAEKEFLQPVLDDIANNKKDSEVISAAN